MMHAMAEVGFPKQRSPHLPLEISRGTRKQKLPRTQVPREEAIKPFRLQVPRPLGSCFPMKPSFYLFPQGFLPHPNYYPYFILYVFTALPTCLPNWIVNPPETKLADSSSYSQDPGMVHVGGFLVNTGQGSITV